MRRLLARVGIPGAATLLLLSASLVATAALAIKLGAF